jgi:hypothetical protein
MQLTGTGTFKNGMAELRYEMRHEVGVGKFTVHAGRARRSSSAAPALLPAERACRGYRSRCARAAA